MPALSLVHGFLAMLLRNAHLIQVGTGHQAQRHHHYCQYECYYSHAAANIARTMNYELGTMIFEISSIAITFWCS